MRKKIDFRSPGNLVRLNTPVDRRQRGQKAPQVETTRASLLVRVKDPADTEAWRQFYDLYAPLLYRYARARGLPREDAEDVRAHCYEIIVRQIGQFDYDREKGGFKAWLRTLVNRRVIDLLRKRRKPELDDSRLEQLATTESGPDDLWEQHWRNQHLRYCVELVRRETSQVQFQAFELIVLKEKSVDEACEELGFNANQVYKAKSRILRRVRQKMEEVGFEDFDP